MSVNLLDGNFLGTSSERVERKIFHCSDGMSFNKFRTAYKHEMHLRIPSFFPESALVQTLWMCKPDLYYFNKHVALKCGVYRVVMQNQLDLTVINYFFRGIKEKLDYPEDDAFPMTVDIEIYYEKVPGVILDSAQWRLYNEDNYR